MQFHRSLELRQIDLAGRFVRLFSAAAREKEKAIYFALSHFFPAHTFIFLFFIRLRHLISLSRTIFLAALDQGKKPSSNLLANLAVHNHQPFPPSFSLISCIETEPFFRYIFFFGGGLFFPPFLASKAERGLLLLFPPFFLFFSFFGYSRKEPLSLCR